MQHPGIVFTASTRNFARGLRRARWELRWIASQIREDRKRKEEAA